MMLNFEAMDKKKQSKMHSNERGLVLKTVEGKYTKNNSGLTDSRLFTGDNKLLAIFDPNIRLWYLRYEVGLIPMALRQNFTSFNTLIKYVKAYFLKRNIEVKEVEDLWLNK